MKKITINIIIFLIILCNLNTVYGAESKILRAKFTERVINNNGFKEITIEPYRYDGKQIEDTEDTTYHIYLPSGYLVEGKSATYVADRNGKYIFTVYYGNQYRTFVHEVKDIKTKEESKDSNLYLNLLYDYELKYDYEKKQIFFNMNLDKLRHVKSPNGETVTNQINYYIKELQNNAPFEFTVTVDENEYNFKIIRSGEYYLLIYLTGVNYNDYSTLVEYRGYNFTDNNYYEVIPAKDIYEDNGNYEVLVKSANSQHVFNFAIKDIDYRRPSVSVGMLEDYTLSIEAEDDFYLDYIITFDGKYVPISGNTSKFSYNHKLEIRYTGEYIFTVVDKKGNRTVKTSEIKRNIKPRRHAINLDVHNVKNADELFKNLGIEYIKSKDEQKYFENILPAYMNGKSPDNFNPNSPITRAEIITIFCRLNNIPYDTSAYLKTKFTDIQNHWARDYISMGSSKKYVSGYKDNTFKPDSNITRAEFCQMLTKISSYKTYLNNLPASSNVTFADINKHWAEKEIIKIAGRNLVTSDNNYFYPDKPITRGEVVHAINMLYGINPSYIELAHIMGLYNRYFDFKDIDNHKYYYDILVSVVGMYREKIN